MKTEISRDSHQPGKRYSGVYQQQGRVLADADWNELVEILKDRLNDTLKDVVGNGSPLHRNVVDNTTSPPSLQWGYVYVDGVQAVVRPDDGATLQPVLEYEHQEDFPTAPDLPSAPDDNYVLYADVWERTVTHLMDERLRDKGLHGADTCSRKQTLAQVKWCGVAVDPEQSEKNPVKGDANLSLTLLHKTSESDPCDPCAAELNVESRVGNYLFRVEVHDVKGDADGPSEITLKWSGENGAEQFEAMPTKEHMPVGFISDKWVYEFFDETSEKHLGVHLGQAAPDPVRGVLTEIKEPASPYLVPPIPGSSATTKFVRRWDGYCRLNLTSKTLIEGVDRGIVLSTSKAAGAPGFVKINSSLEMILASIRLDMILGNKKFVAGDYWLADVREAAHDPLDPQKSKLIEDERPHGIVHRYLTLGKVAGGVLQDNAEADRKYAFPSLTEMTRMFMAGGDGQEVMPGEPLPQALRVGVANGEWPVHGAVVRFQIEDGGGSLTPLIGGKTDSDGIAECEWTPGNVAINPPDPWPRFEVKATLVDPDDSARDLDHPPVYFYANLISADQVAYEPGCPVSGENAIHSHLVTDSELNLGADNFYTVKEVLDALLCKLRARHIPYDVTASNSARWQDVNVEEDPASTPPETVQDAIDDLLENLHSEDIKYPLPDCSPDTNTLKSHIAADIANIVNEGGQDYARIKDLWDALLCHLDASKLPYNPNASPAATSRWRDINEQPAGSVTEPNTVQDAIDDLIKGLESTDIRYEVPECGTAATPTVRSALGISTGAHKIDEILDKLLCEFKATDLPIDRGADLCAKLKNDSQVKTVQDALNVVCRTEGGGGCAVTVGEGGRYPSLESAFASDELKKEIQVSICLLPRTEKGNHVIEKLIVSGKDSISITGDATVVVVQGSLSLEANNIALNGIHFFVTDNASSGGTGTGNISLSSPKGGDLVVEQCHFSRTFYGKTKWFPLVTVGKQTSLQWTNNRMEAARLHQEIRDAAIPGRAAIPAASLDAYDELVAVWHRNPYEDPDAYEADATAVAEKIAGLTSADRDAWHAKRPVTLINKLSSASMRVSIPGAVLRRGGVEPTRGSGGVEPTPGRGGVEPTPGRGTVEPTPGRGGAQPLPGTGRVPSIPGRGGFEPIRGRGGFEPIRGLAASLGRRSAVSEVSPKAGVEKFFELLKADGVLDVAEITDAIRTVSALVRTHDYALALESNSVWGWITNNDISGNVALYFAQDDTAPLSWTSAPSDDSRRDNKRKWADGKLAGDLSPNYQLSLQGNNLAAVHSMVPGATLKAIHTILTEGVIPDTRIQAYESMTVSDNTFSEGSSSFVSEFLNMSGNQFFHQNAKGATLAYTLGIRGAFLGNISYATSGAKFQEYKIEQIFAEAIGAFGSNLLTIV